MNARTLAIVLGVALTASVAVNLFAATAAYTALNGGDRVEQAGGKGRDGRHASARELETQGRVRQALREAGLAAHPDFEQARELRRQAIAAAGSDPFDPVRVDALLDQSRAAELRGRERLEADAMAILATLEPSDRAAFAQILNRGKGGGASGRNTRDHPPQEK
jgi:uncharacterized membrane protein